ncbi:MAG: DEAD/DEAH box helicase [Thermoplasmata archaeon]|nr:DEAD/DEAH box helicase [Thermoplasmata archaeon]MCI4359258.1 DEAD/DEAH box helicase [Thermoplasmata archaeon]
MSSAAAGPRARLDARLREVVVRRGWAEPTEIQRLAAGLLDTRADALLVSPTGTGKTEAVLLPLLSQQLADPPPPVSLLYVTPLRALNRDLEHRLVTLVEEVGLRAAVRHGDTSAAARLSQSKRPPDLLLTTPETLPLLLMGKRLREGLRHVRAVIVDEVHELVSNDRGAQLALTLERLDEWVGRPIRRIGLSATVGNPREVARYLSPAPRAVEVTSASTARKVRLTARVPTEGLTPLPTDLDRELKADPVFLAALRTVAEEIRAHETTLIFVNTRPTAEGLAARLRLLAPDLPIAVHHGSLSREVREEAERQFRDGALRALVATSSLELGIDIGSVDFVVHFGSPHQAGRLLQRVGRSGHRVGREIRGTVLALDDEDLEEAAVLARRAASGEVEPSRWRTANRMAAAQQMVAAVRADGSRRTSDLIGTLRRAAAVSTLDDADWARLTEYLEGLGSLRREGNEVRSGRSTLERFYSTLSLIPDERTYRLRDIATRKPIGVLDERFVVTRVLAEPDHLFLLHGRTWKVVEFREGELLVEGVREIGQEPRWVGEDLPVPFDVAQEIGRLRRDRTLDAYPLEAAAQRRLAARLAALPEGESRPDDRTITVTVNGRTAVFGAAFGNRTNLTLATVAAGLLAARLGARVEVQAVEPTWFILLLPVALDGAALSQSLAVPADTLDGLLEKLVPAGLEYRWTFLTVARKFGALPASADPRDLRLIEPLLEAARASPLGEEALEKTLFERHDVEHAREVLERIGRGDIALRTVAPSGWTELPLSRLAWRELPDVPPPTLLKAVSDRLRDEALTLVCLRCGFTRTTTAARYESEGGSDCRICHGSLSAVVAPNREADVANLARYAKKKWSARRASTRTKDRRRLPESLPALVRQGYTTAELLAHHGANALLCLAARGIGPETARRILARPYRNPNDLVGEILKAERRYARNRAFWD